MDLLINVNHAIGIVGHWIFDSNYNKALFLTQKSDPVDTCDNFSCQLTEAFHVLYNVQSDDKCKNELKDWCRDTDNLFPGQED